jgi:SAM-dependent methyltransferase
MREQSYGQKGLTFVDRFGVFLSRRPIVRVLRRYEQPEVLDIGCGYHARLLVDLEPRISRGVGVDVEVSDQIKNRSKLSFLESPIEEALDHLADQAFDVVLMVSVLEHLWEPREILSACHGLLRAGGALVVNVPNWLGKRFLEFSAFRLGLSPAIEMDDHKMYYSKRDLWPMLVRAGFKPSRIRLRYHKFGLNLFAVATKS